MSNDKPRTYKPINVTVDNWHKYNNAAIRISAERGKRISIPALLDEAFNSMEQHRGQAKPQAI